MSWIQLLLGDPSDHPYFEQAYWIAQILLVLIAFLAARFGYKQATLFERFEILRYLQGSEIRQARNRVLSQLLGKPYLEWTEEDKYHASTVCASYDIVGSLIRMRGWFAVFRGRFFVKGWAISIIRTYEALVPFIEERKHQNGTDVWSDYRWLYTKALPYRPKSTSAHIVPLEHHPGAPV